MAEAALLLKCAEMSRDVYSAEKDFLYDASSCDGYKILAIEGTQEKTDWITNIKFLFKRNDMHRGFKANAERTLTNMIADGLDMPHERRLVITGHSLGGASATCLADILKERYPDLILVTFGSPRPGGTKLKKRMSDIKHYRYVHGDDIVPRTPPALLGGFVHTAPKIELEDEDDRLFDGVDDHMISHYVNALKKEQEAQQIKLEVE